MRLTVFTPRKSTRTDCGAGRLGQATAVNARRGLIGSDFGTANIGAVETKKTGARRYR